ncbi:hypothetical protein PUNSTDRAFT_78412 [Punctularia strigosozonata HHB-11173 SS5]|uniref:Uncharacterized protein n=1 Tax=Punctularia strigosozonata (strain HHB-11173) TaxID=741275 RepID=R7RZA0_PUNST|nr:uncharacterized protein PUNSTDRAFT_78412 [Punctularia strigosozonata HHB-11173 SS5]EIN03303.1 hypothetical protein PUNSTDRAFT_78412 [Punctularia strigosozonata HHB-11173 SS5]
MAGNLEAQADSVHGLLDDIHALNDRVACLLADLEDLRLQNLCLLRDLAAKNALATTLSARLHVLVKQRNAIRAQRVRAQKRLKAAVAAKKEAEKLSRRSHNFRLKHKGIHTDRTRSLARKLVSKCKVPMHRVNDVVHAVADELDITVLRDISRRTVQRAVREGGIASKIQITNALHDADGITLSGDGTTHRHVNYVSKCAITTQFTPSPALLDPDTESLDTQSLGTYTTRHWFLGISSAGSHTSQAQHDGWISSLESMHAIQNSRPSAQSAPKKLVVRDLAQVLFGYACDHSNDQFSLVNRWKDWKEVNSRLSLGESVFLNKSTDNFTASVMELLNAKIARAGGWEAWKTLSPMEQAKHDTDVFREMCLYLGTGAYDALSPEDRTGLDFFARAGCCMHKELNTFKGGNAAMMAMWAARGLEPPMKLLNVFNAASASTGSAADRQRAIDSSTSGGVKLVQLCGALFNHKDDKKGYHDTFSWWLEARSGYRLVFPDTSNTRYGSYGDGAGFCLWKRHAISTVLDELRDTKGSRTFTNLEKNVYYALQDVPTLTELAVEALYYQGISVPYMQHVRGAATRDGAYMKSPRLGPVPRRSHRTYPQDHC